MDGCTDGNGDAKHVIAPFALLEPAAHAVHIRLPVALAYVFVGHAKQDSRPDKLPY